MDTFDPCRAAVPFWGRTSHVLSNLTPKRGCGAERVRWELMIGSRCVPCVVVIFARRSVGRALGTQVSAHRLSTICRSGLSGGVQVVMYSYSWVRIPRWSNTFLLYYPTIYCFFFFFRRNLFSLFFFANICSVCESRRRERCKFGFGSNEGIVKYRVCGAVLSLKAVSYAVRFLSIRF